MLSVIWQIDTMLSVVVASRVDHLLFNCSRDSQYLVRLSVSGPI